jgi:hypothetical protein
VVSRLSPSDRVRCRPQRRSRRLFDKSSRPEGPAVVQAPAILHRHRADDVPDVQLVRLTRALVRRCDREWRSRLQVGRPRTRSHAGGALDRDIRGWRG